MFSYVFANDTIKIEEKLEKIRQKKCDSHNKYKASHFCTNLSCVKNSTSFLCEFCYKNHSQNHINCQEIKSVGDLFSMKRFTQMKEDCRIDPAYQEKIDAILQDVDNIFGKLKDTLCNIIDQECKKAKANIQQKFSLEKRKIFSKKNKMANNLFMKKYSLNSIMELDTENKYVKDGQDSLIDLFSFLKIRKRNYI